ncbi:MAG: ester cyclase [bacterium]
MGDAKANIRRWFEEIWNLRRFATIDEFWGPATAVHDASPQASEVTQAKDFRAMAEDLLAAFPDLHMQIHEVIGEGNYAALRFTATGTHRGVWMGVPATGRSFKIGGLALAEWNGDTLVRGWNNIDLLSLMTELGLLKPPGG